MYTREQTAHMHRHKAHLTASVLHQPVYAITMWHWFDALIKILHLAPALYQPALHFLSVVDINAHRDVRAVGLNLRAEWVGGESSCSDL